MNTREQKRDLIQPLLQEFKIDINEPAFSQQPMQHDKKRSKDFNFSIIQLDELINKIDNCILILNELKNAEALKLESTANRKCNRHKETIAVIAILLAGDAIFSLPFLTDRTAAHVISAVMLSLWQIYSLFILCRVSKEQNLRKQQSFAIILDIVDENEKKCIFELARELEINPCENSLIDFIKLMENKKSDLIYKRYSGPCKAAFLMGGDFVYGAKSSVRTLFNNTLFDKKVCGMFFEFAGFSEPSKKEKAERVTTELMNTLFLTHKYDHEKDDRIIQEVLSYLGLNNELKDDVDNALVKYAL